MKIRGLVVSGAALSLSLSAQASAQGIFGKLKDAVNKLERAVTEPQPSPSDASTANPNTNAKLSPLRRGDDEIYSGAGCAFSIAGKDYLVTDYTAAIIRIDDVSRDLSTRMNKSMTGSILFDPFDTVPQFDGHFSGTGTGLAGFEVKITPLRQFTSSGEEESSAPATIEIWFKEFLNMDPDDDRTRIYQTIKHSGILSCYA